MYRRTVITKTKRVQSHDFRERNCIDSGQSWQVYFPRPLCWYLKSTWIKITFTQGGMVRGEIYSQNIKVFQMIYSAKQFVSELIIIWIMLGSVRYCYCFKSQKKIFDKCGSTKKAVSEKFVFTGQQVSRSVGACANLGRIVQTDPQRSSGCHRPRWTWEFWRNKVQVCYGSIKQIRAPIKRLCARSCKSDRNLFLIWSISSGLVSRTSLYRSLERMTPFFSSAYRMIILSS